MKKTYILDTNVLLDDAGALFNFKNNDIVIPFIVIEELDRHKDRQDEEGRNAREVARSLALLMATDDINLSVGISLGMGLGTLRILSLKDVGSDKINIPEEFEKIKSGDNTIIKFCLGYKEKFLEENSTLITGDILLQIKCKSFGIKCQKYEKINFLEDFNKNIETFYSGVTEFTISEEQMKDFYSSNGLVLSSEQSKNLYSNQFLILKSESGKSGLARFIKTNRKLRMIRENRQAWNIKGKNKEQDFALDLLFDDDVKLVTITGNSGAGKSLLSIAVALEQILEHKKYNKLIITRTIQPLGRDIGALPGSLEEKMEPWIGPFKDNLEFLLSENMKDAIEKGALESQKKKKGTRQPFKSIMMEEYFQRGIIEVEAVTFIRGRSIPNCFIILDESQNSSLHEIKTVLTRVGEGSKIVLLGDINQIDTPNLNQYSNGLSIVIEKFKEHEIAGHITMKRGERSPLATLASNILNF